MGQNKYTYPLSQSSVSGIYYSAKLTNTLSAKYFKVLFFFFKEHGEEAQEGAEIQ